MSLVKIQGNASGTGEFTIAAPNSNTNRTLTLPDATGTFNTSGAVNEVPAGSASTPSIYPTGDTNTGIFFPAADTIAFAEGGAEVARFDSSGNLGLSVTPSAWSTGTALQVKRASFYTYDNSGVEISQNAAVISGAWQRIGADFATKYGQDTGNHYWYTAASSTAGSAITWSERARITNGGLMLLGLTSTLGANNGFLVTRGTASNFGILVGVETNGYNGIGFVNASNSVVGTITVNSGGTAYNTTSDYRLKENVAPMTGALATVSALKPCTYTWKADGAAGQGFIAHELQAVVPDCVTGEKDATETYTDDNGVEQTRPKYQGVDTSYLVATLTAAIQELKAELDTVKAQNAAFEARLAALEAK